MPVSAPLVCSVWSPASGKFGGSLQPKVIADSITTNATIEKILSNRIVRIVILHTFDHKHIEYQS